MKRFSRILLSVCLLLMSLGGVLTSLPEVHAETSISNVRIYIDSPVEGNAPDYYPVFPSDSPYYSSDYSSAIYKNDIAWHNVTDDEYLEVDSQTFMAGCEYEVILYISAKGGYAFKDTATAKVNNNSAECRLLSSSGQLQVRYNFSYAKKLSAPSLSVSASQKQARNRTTPPGSLPACTILSKFLKTSGGMI